jgi:hypothetical protein
MCTKVFLFAILVVGVFVPSVSFSADADQADNNAIRNAYCELLKLFPEDRQGYCLDRFKQATAHQPMAYGLVLSAESLRAKNEKAEKDSPAYKENRRRVRKAAGWLLDNRDLDNDGKPGWGLPQSWDAWGDKTVNPSHQPYTITSAIVLNGLLDALQVPGLFSEDERKEVLDVINSVTLRWCREVWSDGYGGGYFWYSPSKVDKIFGINAPVMFLGSMVRILDEQGQSLSPHERTLIRSRADSLAKAAVATVKLRNGEPFWSYAPLPNRFNRESQNDLVHHVYILIGIEEYRDSDGSSVTLPWSREKAIASVDRFFAAADRQKNKPERILERTSFDNPNGPQARLWGAGFMLAFYAKWADEARTDRAFQLIKEHYGPLSKPYWVGPDAKYKDKKVCYPRHAAHLLYGLSIAAFE